MSISIKQLKYIAGFFDVNGDIRLVKKEGTLFPKITLVSKEFNQLKYINNLLSIDEKIHIYFDSYIINFKNGTNFLQKIEPYLTVKKPKANYIIKSDQHDLEEFILLESMEDFQETDLEYLSGFLDGEDCCILNNEILIKYKPEYKFLFKYMQSYIGGSIKSNQYTLSTNKDNIENLVSIAKTSRLKKYKIILLLYDYSQSKKSSTLLDKLFSFDLYQELASRTAIYDENKWLEYLALGIASEAGEVAGKVKKYLRGDRAMDKEYAFEILSEISDVNWYAANLCRSLGERIPSSNISYEESHKLNVEKLFDRWQRKVLTGDGDKR